MFLYDQKNQLNNILPKCLIMFNNMDFYYPAPFYILGNHRQYDFTPLVARNSKT